MTQTRDSRWIRGVATLVACFTFATLAESVETDWSEHQFAESRLVASHETVPSEADAILYLGWEIRLPKGWKTYWRSPGDAGRPPEFDWTGSVNLERAEVLFPHPERFEIFGLQTFGYKDEIVLPIRLYPIEGGRPINIRLSVWFMTCKDICVPIEADYELDLPVGEGTATSREAASIFEQLPRVPTAGQDRPGPINIDSVRVRGLPGYQRLSIDVQGERHLSGSDVIVEADNIFRFGLPQKALLGDGREARFIIPIESFTQSADLKGRTVTVTASDGWGAAVEQTFRLNNRGIAPGPLAKAN